MQPQTAKQYLKVNNWTQDEAARALQVGTSYLNRVINGHERSDRLIAAIFRLKPQGPKKRPVYA